MVGTVFLSGSRGGMLAILVELVVFAVVVFRKQQGIRIAIGAAAFAILLVGLLAWLGGKEVTTRVSSISTEAHSEISGGVRLSIDRDGLQMFRHKPVLGWGFGTFPVVYPQFRSFYTNFFVNEAHNDYLQLLAEMGSCGFAVMIWFVIVLYRSSLRKIGNWNSDVSCAATLACTSGLHRNTRSQFFRLQPANPRQRRLILRILQHRSRPVALQRSKKRRPVSS